MPYPKKMTDNERIEHGFGIDPSIPDRARNGNSTRYHCVDCGIWANKANGPEGERVCDPCFRKRFRAGR